jgi:hypothetical protein
LAAVPPPLSPGASGHSPSAPPWLIILLSLCLGLFIADAFVSLADDSLVFFCELHFLTGIRGIAGLFAALIALLIYGLMALVPAIPKRWFIPVTLFNLFAALAGIPFLIFFYEHAQLIAWSISLCQVILGLWILHRLQGGFKFGWPLVPANQLVVRRFSWRNLSVFMAANLFVLLPAVMIYFFFCATLAVGHFSEGFMSLHPGGLTVQVRTYVRNDGKTIRLFPMAHVAEADFYQKVSQSFPTNSIILMEGVTDTQNLITNKISYERMAKSLGLAEQHQKFVPTRGEMVRADVDVSLFSKDTLEAINLVMRIHSQGVNFGNVQALLQYSPSPHMEDELFDDLLRKRNQHLLEEIQAWLPKSDNLMVPWGVAHMPGISKEIQQSGFHLVDSHDYQVIRFHF